MLSRLLWLDSSSRRCAAPARRGPTTANNGTPRSAAPSRPTSRSPRTIPSPASRRPSAVLPSRWGSTTRQPTSARTSRCGSISAAGAPTSTFRLTGPGIEIDLSGGVKFLAFDKKLSFDFGYIRYLYPGVAADLAYDYGELNLNVGYDFGIATLTGRVRYSPNSFGNSGNSWNKRALLSVPLPFLRLERKDLVQGLRLAGQLLCRPLPGLWHPEQRLLVLADRPGDESLRARLHRGLHRHQHRTLRLRRYQLLRRPRVRERHQDLLSRPLDAAGLRLAPVVAGRRRILYISCVNRCIAAALLLLPPVAAAQSGSTPCRATS